MKKQAKRTYSDDVFYDVWRIGGNVDQVNSDRVEDCYYQGIESQQAARIETEAQRKNIEGADCETTEGK
jgi:hypothetical protein